MVAVDGILLSQCNEIEAGGSVALTLANRSRDNRIYHFALDGWEVELKKGGMHVVARCRKSIDREKLLELGIEVAHKALDLISVEHGDHLTTAAPADKHIGFSREDGIRSVWWRGVNDFSLGMTATIEVRAADGTVVPPQAEPALSWSPAFRFHRLSQGNRDLYDAYRNMFLALEAILDQIFPKQPKEGEKAWILRAVRDVGARVNLADIAAPGTADPAAYLANRLYGIRVQLFHAKTGQTLIPHERVSYLAVAEAYPLLVALWTDIARKWLSLQRGGSAVTYQGFRMMISAAFAALRIGVTADETVPGVSEETLSPKSLPIFVFPEPATLVDRGPGRMELRGKVQRAELAPHHAIGRVGLIMADRRPATIDNIQGGLLLHGADVFEAIIAIRLMNRDMPRTEFA